MFYAMREFVVIFILMIYIRKSLRIVYFGREMKSFVFLELECISYRLMLLKRKERDLIILSFSVFFVESRVFSERIVECGGDRLSCGRLGNFRL